MARSTIAEDIERLEAELVSVREAIAKQKAFRAIEEGSASARFRTEFTDINKLYAKEKEIENKLSVLYPYADGVML